MNDDYTSTFSFPNDFAALSPVPVAPPQQPEHPLLVSKAVSGLCDVVIFHPRHDLTLARLSVEDIVAIIAEWKRLYAKRSMDHEISYVQIFEVRTPHPLLFTKLELFNRTKEQ